jgi:predicted lipoprotein with Yx(FWY)xxD motif
MNLGSRFVRRAAMAVIASAGALGLGLAAPAGAAPAASPPGAIINVLSSSTYGDVLVATIGSYTNIPLYAITSDTTKSFGCTTTLEQTYMGPITCTGPESDFINGVQSDEWPAFTTTGRIQAGPGVQAQLLGTVYRPGIGFQVTYAGRPLYLFDPPSSPFAPAGVGFLETVPDLPPWHGLWDLVSSETGNFVTGPATVETETLPNGKTALAVEEYPNVVPGGVAVTAYSYSRDFVVSTCVGDCARKWIPVLTTGRPQIAGGISAKEVGVIPRPGGYQVTYKGRPLYVYSNEEAVFVNGQPQSTGTVGNGNGLSGPLGGTFSVINP